MVTALGWVLLGPLAAALVTIVAGRLLGARRGWVALLVSGLVGFTAGVLAAGALTGWQWATADMVLVALAFGTLFTMTTALVLDLAAPVGTLAQGEAAGLVTVRSPIVALRRRVAPFRRYREVIGLARKNGVLSRHVSPATLPDGARRTLEEAGGIFVKLGQVASTRTDVLPRAWCDELAGLRSGAAPASEAVMRPHLAEQLGGDPEDAFAAFDWAPMASGSIAQVYRARLHDGDEVVVKVQRPGLDDTLAVDSAAVMQIARLIERRTPLGLTVRPAELAQEFLDGVAEELDFGVEAANAVELAAALRDVDRARIPATYPELSGPRVLTEELVDAPNVGELVASSPELDRIEFADRLMAMFLHHVFVVGVFHADPHPGNILVQADGTIVLIDLGAVGRLGAGHRAAVLDMLLAASAGDAPSLRQALERVTTFTGNIDLHGLDQAIEAYLGRHLRAGGGISASTFEDLAVLIGDYGIRLPRWFGTLSRAFVTLEGTLRGLDPTFSLVDAARRHAGAALGATSPSGIRDAIEHEAMSQLPRLRRLPERIDEVLGQAAAGRLSARVSLLAEDEDRRLVTRLVDRLVLGLIAAATIIGSVQLIGIEAGPTISATVSINEVLGYFGLAAGVVLSLRIVAGIIRDGVL